MSNSILGVRLSEIILSLKIEVLKLSKKFAALSVLIGTIIGAGVLGIPYVVMKSGFAIGVAHIILIGALMILLMLYLGEIVQRTPGNHQLSGYAEKYLGKKGKNWMMMAFAFGILSAILAYIIGEGRSLSYLIFNSPAYEFQLGIAFWIFLSLITYFGIKALQEGEIVGVILIFVTIISMAVYFTNKINIENLSHIYPSQIFIPFGVILFAFLGFSAIPQVKQTLGEDKKSLKKVIINSHIIVAIVYILFAGIVIGFKGDSVPEVATIALGKPFIFLGMLTMFTSYLALSIAMIDTIRLDFNKSRLTSWLYTSIIPIVAFIILSFFNQTTFVKVLGIGGVISGGATAIIILLMAEKAKISGSLTPSYSIPLSKTIFWIISAIFTIGALLEIRSILI